MKKVYENKQIKTPKQTKHVRERYGSIESNTCYKIGFCHVTEKEGNHMNIHARD